MGSIIIYDISATMSMSHEYVLRFDLYINQMNLFVIGYCEQKAFEHDDEYAKILLNNSSTECFQVQLL